MNCNIAEKLIDLYLDNRIDEADARELEDHAELCPPCRTKFLAFERLALAIEDLPRFAAPAGFTQQTMALLTQRQRDAASPRGWAGLALASVLAMLGLVMALQSSGPFLATVPEIGWDSPSDALYNLVVLAISMEASLVIGIGLLTFGGIMGLWQLVSREQRVMSPASPAS